MVVTLFWCENLRMAEDTHVRITLRIPTSLHERLESEAADSSKSLNAQIVEAAQMGLDLRERFNLMEQQFVRVMASDRAKSEEIERLKRALAESAVLPQELRDALSDAAGRNQRSFSDELVFRLVHSFGHDPGVLPSWERAGMIQERDHLTLLIETLRLRKDGLMRDMDAHERTMRLELETANADLQRALQATWHDLKHEQEEVAHRIKDIGGRLREIDADLKLPGIPAIEALMAKMPR